MSQEQVAGEIAAGDILTEFENNAVADSTKYSGQTVTIEGVVASIDFDWQGRPGVDLNSDSMFEWNSVRCFLSNASQTSALSIGTYVVKLAQS